MTLGVGRATKDDGIDPAVGIVVKKHVGDRVECGDILAIAYVNEKGVDRIADEVIAAYELTDEVCAQNAVILDRVE